MKTNADLKPVYDQAHKGGGVFRSRGTTDVTAQVLDAINWSNKAVLEVGCGDGFTAMSLGQRGAFVVAMDYSEEAIKRAKALNWHKSVMFVDENYRITPKSFDVIVAQEILEHTDDPISFLILYHECLKPKGQMVITCPSFLNIRGHIWMTLAKLLDVPMSLTDLHYIMPWQMETWAHDLNMSIEWSTFRYDMAFGKDMVVDMRKRLHNALRDAGLEHDRDKIESMLAWAERTAQYEKPDGRSGAGAIYVLSK